IRRRLYAVRTTRRDPCQRTQTTSKEKLTKELNPKERPIPKQHLKEAFRMKTLFQITLLVAAVTCFVPPESAKTKPKSKPTKCSQGTPYRGCPACGTAKDTK